VRCFIKGRTLYIDREVWAVGCEIDRTPALFDKIDPLWTIAKAADPNWRSIARRSIITADSAWPQSISFMQRNGFSRMRPAVKGAGSVEEGVSFLNQYDIVVHPDCKHVIKELTLYAFKIDPKTNEITSQLEDRENHTIDALRYALEAVRMNRGATSHEFRI
jgi:phage terminase large subunit